MVPCASAHSRGPARAPRRGVRVLPRPGHPPRHVRGEAPGVDTRRRGQPDRLGGRDPLRGGATRVRAPHRDAGAVRRPGAAAQHPQERVRNPRARSRACRPQASTTRTETRPTRAGRRPNAPNAERRRRACCDRIACGRGLERRPVGRLSRRPSTNKERGHAPKNLGTVTGRGTRSNAPTIDGLAASIGSPTRGTDYTLNGASGTGLSYQNLNDARKRPGNIDVSGPVYPTIYPIRQFNAGGRP